jgi:hypothetical protein
VQKATESPEIESNPVVEKGPRTTTASVGVEEPVEKGKEPDTAKSSDPKPWIFGLPARCTASQGEPGLWAP